MNNYCHTCVHSVREKSFVSPACGWMWSETFTCLYTCVNMSLIKWNNDGWWVTRERMKQLINCVMSTRDKCCPLSPLYFFFSFLSTSDVRPHHNTHSTWALLASSLSLSSLAPFSSHPSSTPPPLFLPNLFVCAQSFLFSSSVNSSTCSSLNHTLIHSIDDIEYKIPMWVVYSSLLLSSMLMMQVFSSNCSPFLSESLSLLIRPSSSQRESGLCRVVFLSPLNNYRLANSHVGFSYTQEKSNVYKVSGVTC